MVGLLHLEVDIVKLRMKKKLKKGVKRRGSGMVNERGTEDPFIYAVSVGSATKADVNRVKYKRLCEQGGTTGI